jgi:ABC-type Na+ efflux pump permease subunit
LELILATPLSVRDILRGQMLALRRQFLRPMLVVLVVDFLFLLTDAWDKDWVLLCLAGMTVLVADMYAISWLGMWLGLKARHASRASSAVIVRILILPWLVFLLLWMLFSVLDNWYSRYRVDNDYFPAFWFVISMLVDLAFAAWARNRLHQDFRAVATQRVDVTGYGKSWWPAREKAISTKLPPVIQ